MRKAVAVAAVLVVALASGSVIAAGTQRKAHLRLASVKPLVVQGSAFRSRERVRLVVAASERVVRVIRADTRGGFTASFPHLFVDRCGDGLAIIASGAGGSRAALKLPGLECPPGLGP
jgi:hypothetical protein